MTIAEHLSLENTGRPTRKDEREATMEMTGLTEADLAKLCQ